MQRNRRVNISMVCDDTHADICVCDCVGCQSVPSSYVPTLTTYYRKLNHVLNNQDQSNLC